MVAKYYFDEELAFSLAEEAGFFRLKVDTPEIEEHHVEDFLDTTVEWLSTNPQKGILIDFQGVKYVCPGFVVHLHRYYENIKARGLYVRFVNVDPSIKPYVDVSNITVVCPTVPERAVVSAREMLGDLAKQLSNNELMEKYGLSEKGLAKTFQKLMRKGLMTKSELAKRIGVETCEITVVLDGLNSRKAIVDAASVLEDITGNLSDRELMRKYRLSVKGLQSLFRKLYRRGLISADMLKQRKRRQK